MIRMLVIMGPGLSVLLCEKADGLGSCIRNS
jgi:hypothetical protein